MHIVNLMFGKGLGGIEQALVDYCEALKLEGHKVTAIISKKAKIKPALLPLGVNIIEIKNLGSWDFLAKSYIKKIMAQIVPDAVIAHGNRAVSLVHKNNKSLPIIGVTHNYSIKHLIGLDLIIATTEDLKKKVIEAGQVPEKIVKIPNMVRVSISSKNENPVPSSGKIINIGTMGRFVKKKGFDVFIRALRSLKSQGIAFEACIGGGGEEEQNLKQLAAEFGLLNENSNSGRKQLNFLGWVEDKEKFFEDIDIFVLPSLHEPFGIILLEAFAHKKPVIVSDAEGPSEIATNGVDAIIVPKNDSSAIALAILKLATDKELTDKLVQNAFAKVQTYDIKHFANKLSEAIGLVELLPRKRQGRELIQLLI